MKPPLPGRAGLPLLTLHAPIRPVIGAARGACRRLPVPLTWRTRRKNEAPVGIPQHQRVVSQVDHFHHWSTAIGIDWHIGETSLLRTISVPLFSQNTSMVRVPIASLAHSAAAALQFRQSSDSTITRRTSEIHSVIDSRIDAERVNRYSRTEHNLYTEYSQTHHGVLRQWRITRCNDLISTMILSSGTHRYPIEALSPATEYPRRSTAILSWSDSPATVVRLRLPSLRLIIPHASAVSTARLPSAPRRIVRAPLIVWRGDSPSAPLAFEAARSVTRSVATAATPPLRSHYAEYATTSPSMRSSNPIASPASPTAPDITRLVDEVMRRIERQARSERQRRGL